MIVKSDEDTAKQGLNTLGYAGKWRQAQRIAQRNESTDDRIMLPFWERVRLYFLELGGEYEKTK